MSLVNKSFFMSILCMTIFIFASQAFAQHKEDHPAKAMDKMIDHQIEAIELTKSGKDKSSNDEFVKFFNEMLAEQERDLKNMETTRGKLFPNVNKTAFTKERLSSFSRNIEDEFKKFETEMKRAFDRFSTKLTREKNVALSPKVEIKEDEKGYDIKAEVPGMARDDIKVAARENDLIITGKRESEIKRSSETSTSSEFYYGDYERTIHLDEKVDPKSIKTEYKNGIISVHLNKIIFHKRRKT